MRITDNFPTWSLFVRVIDPYSRERALGLKRTEIDIDHMYFFVLPPDYSPNGSANYALMKAWGDQVFEFRHWYESQHIKGLSQVNRPAMTIALYDENSSVDEEVLELAWHPKGFAVATIPSPLTDRITRRSRLVVQLRADPVILAQLLIAPDQAELFFNEADLFQNLERWGGINGPDFIVGRAPAASRIFASYAREDLWVVEAVASIAEALGDMELRWDLRILRSGDSWEDVLQDEISSADSFQLFWSISAKESKPVHDEWHFALNLHRKGFIKPVYWSEEPPLPPQELRHLHFAKIRMGNVAP